MTQKELLYLEDAYKHECNTIKILSLSKDCLDDKKLEKFIDSQLTMHEDLKKKLYKIMEEYSNE